MTENAAKDVSAAPCARCGKAREEHEQDEQTLFCFPQGAADDGSTYSAAELPVAPPSVDAERLVREFEVACQAVRPGGFYIPNGETLAEYRRTRAALLAALGGAA